MSITIRNYKQEDLPAILQIINFNIINSTSLYDYNIRSLALQKTILEEKIAKNFPVFVAEINNICVGFGMYAEFRFREAYCFTVEHSIYVDEKYQGLGIGKLLIEKLIEKARNQNLHTMIGVIDSENESSIKFHEQYGFQIVGTIKESGFKFNRWLHSIIMQKML